MAISQPQSDQQRQHSWQPNQQPEPLRQEPDQPEKQQEQREQRKEVQEAKKAVRGLKSFWAKFNNDWVLNLAAMLAYNLLMTIVPILAMLLSFFGLFLGGLAPGAEQQFINQISNAIPGGKDFIEPALNRLAASSGAFAVLTIVLSAWFGSRLFVVIEQCFGVIYRLPIRGFVRQNIIALLMMLIFVILVPLMLAVSAAPSFLATSLVDKLLGNSLAARIWLMVATALAGFIIASALFLAIYSVIPNRPLRIQDAWKGALIAGALLEVYIVAFPFYATLFLKPGNYGSTAGFAVLVLVFFYYFGVILLLGAEINSFLAGQRQTATSLPGVLYELQVRKSAAGAAGPTAGELQEDLQADRTGLNITMTPAPNTLHPPTKEEEERRVQEREQRRRHSEVVDGS